MRNPGLHMASFLAALAVAYPATTFADSMVNTGAAHANPMKVNKCDPQLKTNYHTGYAPGYYPRYGPYAWNDVYGYRYTQTAVSKSAHLGIDYVNMTSAPMSSIEFGLVARGSLIAEVKDVGKFSPGVEIKHEFGVNANVFPIGTALPACVPLRITYADGTTWKNPHNPALHRSIYQAR